MLAFRAVLSALALLMAWPAWCQDVQPVHTEEDAKAARSLAEGTRLLQQKMPEQAIQVFDGIVASYEGRFKDDKTRYFSARTQAESRAYALEVGNAATGGTQIVSPTWAYAHYLKAYGLLDLRRNAEAKASLQRALMLSPHNSQFLSELAGAYQREKDWGAALETFQRAAASAQEFSPAELRSRELSRAWRGMGYVLVRQRRLDEAEKIYRQCLELDQKDSGAISALRYIEGLRLQQGAE